jgi:hypothetical protein
VEECDTGSDSKSGISNTKITRAERSVLQALCTVAIGHHNLIHLASTQIIAQVEAPVIASPAPLPQSGGIDQADTTPKDEWHRSRSVGHQPGQEPSQPRVGPPQAFAPGSRRDIGNVVEHAPDPKGGERIGCENVGQQRAQEISRAGKSAMALEGMERVGLHV